MDTNQFIDMKTFKYIALSMLSIGILTSSCAKKDAFSSEYDKSLKAFESFKASANNNYSYIAVERPINFAYSETKLTVKDGLVTARDYWFYEYKVSGTSGTGSYQLSKEWHETADKLNSHGGEGANLYALDQIYSRAKTEWLPQDKDRYDIFFEANNDGMISKAGYQRKSGCTEGCFIGAEIKSISK